MSVAPHATRGPCQSPGRADHLIGEMNAGHTSVGGGDLPKPARVATGLLSAEFQELKMGKLIGKRSWGGVVGIARPECMVPHLSQPGCSGGDTLTLHQ